MEKDITRRRPFFGTTFKNGITLKKKLALYFGKRHNKKEAVFWDNFQNRHNKKKAVFWDNFQKWQKWPFSTLILRFSVNILAYRQKFKKRSWSFFQNHPKSREGHEIANVKFQMWVHLILMLWVLLSSLKQKFFSFGQKTHPETIPGYIAPNGFTRTSENLIFCTFFVTFHV